ncbi:Glycosyltransferase involved in cell wall bisynthesis [Mariprofundus ferrinatatus]|uniref:Glycosyltransferase involved in cell wall bisynthesis n=1 Tax=Mariprofundus ferrinatatus TaxID=1921087 RepID=A0A2K8L369_9PROT|nr:glycosyltransferase family 2 protein [Mariprofundus ferrinatatus]ATX81780.1 Glycosyltransferase involved in cell wall bisynthesis [Mariprofundus ferrinatatus]
MDAELKRTNREMQNAAPKLLTVVAPVFNEGDVLREFYERLLKVLCQIEMRYEILFVNDGSEDETLSIIDKLRDHDPNVGVIDLTRNFGKEIALTAGLDHARGDAVINIDADLQDPPELIPRLIEKWQEGYDVVYATRTDRRGESSLRKFSASIFYRLIHWSASIRIPRDTGDYRLLSRRAVNALIKLREQHRFMKGLFSWIGYSQVGIPFEREPREAGSSKWSFWQLWNFALEGLTSFTTVPLKVASYVGALTATCAFLYGMKIIIATLLFGDPVAGYPTIMVTMLFLGGVQLLSIGVLGEYMARIFDESKKRPLYLVKTYLPSESNTPDGEQ